MALSLPQAVLTAAVIAGATVAASQNIVGGDALFTLYGTVLGYVFGNRVAAINGKKEQP